MILKIVEVIWYLIRVAAFWTISGIFFIVAVLVRPFHLRTAIQIFQKCLRLFFVFFGLRLEFNFKNEDSRQASNTVFVLLNQFSFLDSMICPILPVPRTLGIMNIEMAMYPILGWFLGICNFVIIRQWPAQAKRVVNRTSEFLRSGGNMVISIEGKRSKDGKLNEYKKGSVVMAITNQSDIVPFIIRGTFESLPMKSLYTRPGELSVTFLEPISTQGMTYDDRNDLRDQLLAVAHENGLK